MAYCRWRLNHLLKSYLKFILSFKDRIFFPFLLILQTLWESTIFYFYFLLIYYFPSTLALAVGRKDAWKVWLFNDLTVIYKLDSSYSMKAIALRSLYGTHDYMATLSFSHLDRILLDRCSTVVCLPSAVSCSQSRRSCLGVNGMSPHACSLSILQSTRLPYHYTCRYPIHASYHLSTVQTTVQDD